MSSNRVLFIGGADELQLNPPNGTVYHPGDVLLMPDAQRISLRAAGLRFGAVPDEPEPEPQADVPPLDPVPPEMAEKVVQERAARKAADEKPDVKTTEQKGGS